jgi:hypothetical protein
VSESGSELLGSRKFEWQFKQQHRWLYSILDEPTPKEAPAGPNAGRLSINPRLSIDSRPRLSWRRRRRRRRRRRSSLG